MSFSISLPQSDKTRPQGNYEAEGNYLCQADTISIDKIWAIYL